MKRNLRNMTAVIAFAVLFGTCGNRENQQSNEHPEESFSIALTTAIFKDVDPSVKSEIDQVFQHYIHLKNALVSSSLSETKAGAQKMIGALEAVDTVKFTGEQKVAFGEQVAKIKENAAHIVETSEIAHQREHLNPITDGIYNLLKSFGGSKTMYYDFCPMANKDQGGYWVSESKEIKNPYFGEEMLSCGEVKEIITGD